MGTNATDRIDYCRRWNPSSGLWERASRSDSRIVWSRQLHRGVWVPREWDGDCLTDYAHAENAA